MLLLGKEELVGAVDLLSDQSSSVTQAHRHREHPWDPVLAALCRQNGGRSASGGAPMDEQVG